MSKHPAIELIESKHLKKAVPSLRPGDVVRVHQRIIEAGKERIQVFEGLVISIKGDMGMNGTFKVRRIASGVGVERTYPLHSPKIAKIERVKASKVRRAKLYYIRELTGRKARLKGEQIEGEIWDENTAADEAVTPETVEDIVESEEEVEAPQTEDFETVAENEISEETEGSVTATEGESSVEETETPVDGETDKETKPDEKSAE